MSEKVFFKYETPEEIIFFGDLKNARLWEEQDWREHKDDYENYVQFEQEFCITEVRMTQDEFDALPSVEYA